MEIGLGLCCTLSDGQRRDNRSVLVAGSVVIGMLVEKTAGFEAYERRAGGLMW